MPLEGAKASSFIGELTFHLVALSEVKIQWLFVNLQQTELFQCGSEYVILKFFEVTQICELHVCSAKEDFCLPRI